MSFSTLTFLLVFLPLLLLLYYLCPPRFAAARNGILLVFSLLFFAWGSPIYILMILVCTFLTYLLSFLVENGSPVGLFFAVLLNLAPFAVFRYGDFILLNVCPLLGRPVFSLQLPLPVGISIYTLQIISYLVDLYRRKVSVQQNYFYLLLYGFFFPTLAAGPVVRYADVESDLRLRGITAGDLYEGARRLVIGLSKKVLIADTAGQAVRVIRDQNPSDVGPLLLWICAVCFGVQIYYDFSGYSDMAIGLGRLFGFHYPENFERPYAARSVTEFWRRWFISLTSFFRFYVYTPLCGNKPGPVRRLFAFLLVCFLFGMWHGAYWSYALWGAYWFLLLTLERYVYGRMLEKLPGFLARAVTLALCMFGWAIFLCETNSVRELIFSLSHLFGAYAPAVSLSLRGLEIQGNALTAGLGLILCIPDFSRLFRTLEYRVPTAARLLSGASLLLLLCASILRVAGSSVSSFDYFRF